MILNNIEYHVSQFPDIFETYHKFSNLIDDEPESKHPIDSATVNKIQHGVTSALRNLSLPAANKRAAAAAGRAAPLLVAALPRVHSHLVAYKLLATLRMLLDGQGASHTFTQNGCHMLYIGNKTRLFVFISLTCICCVIASKRLSRFYLVFFCLKGD